MDVFGHGTDEPSRPLLPPGTCWLCDQSPIQEAQKVIDTRRNARPGGPTVHESVRKYICEGCARDLGGAVGMVTPEEHEAATRQVEKYMARASELETQLSVAESSLTKVVDVREVTAALMPMLVVAKENAVAAARKSNVPPPVE